MMKKFILLFSIVFGILNADAQIITWTDVTADFSTLPQGVILKKGICESPKLQIWLLDVDLNQTEIAVRPYLGTAATVPTLIANNEAFAAINGGFFFGSSSFSSVVYPAQVKAQNVTSVTRIVPYPVIRSMFWLNTNFEPSVDWIYHFGPELSDIYTFSAPLDYIYNDPNPKIGYYTGAGNSNSKFIGWNRRRARFG